MPARMLPAQSTAGTCRALPRDMVMTPRVAAVAKLEPSSQESAQLRRNEQGRKNSGSMTPRLMLTRQAMVPLARQLAVSMPIMTKTSLNAPRGSKKGKFPYPIILL